MIKFVVFHSEEFKHPIHAFCLGLGIMLANIFVASTNLANSFKQNNIEGVIGKFVSFKVLLQIQDYYMRQRSNFRIKKAVQSEPLMVLVNYKKIFPEEPIESEVAE